MNRSVFGKLLHRIAPLSALFAITLLGTIGQVLNSVHAADEIPSSEIKGQRIFTAGHSFHYFMPPIFTDVAKGAKIADHKQVGTQSIGGSRVIQHWDLPDEKNKVKPALKTGEIDVLTLSPIYLPDDGIEKLAQLGLEHNPAIRVFAHTV